MFFRGVDRIPAVVGPVASVSLKENSGLSIVDLMLAEFVVVHVGDD